MYLVHYWALILLAPGLIAVGLSVRRRGYTLGPALRVVTLRVLTLVVIVLLVGDLHWHMRDSIRHHVFAIDVSDSFSPNLPAAEQLVRRTLEGLPATDRVSILVFAGSTRAIPPGSTGPMPEGSLTAGLEAGATEVTDFGELFRTVNTLVRARESVLLYLISDGIATAGDSPEGELMQLKRRGVALYPFSTRAAYAGDVRILSATGPSRVLPGQSFNVQATVFSEIAGNAAVRLTGPATDLSTTVDLKAGVPASVEFNVSSPSPGINRYVLAVSGTPDPVTANDRLSLVVSVPVTPRLLALGAVQRSVLDILRTLPGFQVQAITDGPHAINLPVTELADTTAVVVDGLAVRDLPVGAQRSLRRFVQEMGGGLVMLGGPQSFALGGWSDTDVEAVLPVLCDPRDPHKQPLAIVLVLDSSGSMAQGTPSKMELAQRASLGVVSVLSPEDRVAMISFRVKPQLLVPLVAPVPPDSIRRAVFSINPGGGTDMYPALTQAVRTLTGSPQQIRHVLILSDGRSQSGDTRAVARLLTQEKVSLSAVLTGEQAETQALQELARDSGGRFYVVSRMSDLATVFLDDVRRVSGELHRGPGSYAIDRTGTFPFAMPAGPPAATTISRYNRVRARETASVLWQTHVDERTTEPVLVIGQAGVGRSVAMMTGPGSDWAGTLNSWSGLGPLLGNLVRWVARPPGNPDFDMALIVEGRNLAVSVDAVHDGRAVNFRRLSVHLEDVEGTSEDVPLTQTAPGQYRAQATVGASESYVATLLDLEAGVVLDTGVVTTPYAQEYRRFVPDRESAARWAGLTGGRVLSDPAEVVELTIPGQRAYHSLAWPLVLLLLGLFSADAVLRALGRI